MGHAPPGRKTYLPIALTKVCAFAWFVYICLGKASFNEMTKRKRQIEGKLKKRWRLHKRFALIVRPKDLQAEALPDGTNPEFLTLGDGARQKTCRDSLGV